MPAIFHVKIEDESFDGAVNHIVEASDDDTVWHCEEAGDNFDGAIFHVKWAEDGHEEPVWRVSGISRGTVTTVGPAVSPLSLTDAIANSLQYVKAYGGTEQRNLPAGYTELQYIESTGTQYIDTGIVTQNGIGFDVTFLTNNSAVPGNLSYGAILGGRVSSGDNDFQITTFTPVGSTMGTIRNGPSTPVISAKISTNTKLHISLINDVITYNDGTTASVSSYEYTAGKNIYLFGINSNDSFTQSGDGCRIYNAKLLVGSNVVFDGIPAKQGTTVGMYDLVSGQFFTNAGTGEFTAGPEAVPTPDAPVDIVSNNGVIKVSPNLLDPSKFDRFTSTQVRWYYQDGYLLKAGKTYTFSTNYTGCYLYFMRKSDNASLAPSNTNRVSYTPTEDVLVYFRAYKTPSLEDGYNFRLEEGSTATTGIYVDGLTETIRDSAGHTATAQMLLSVGDYKDEQEILSGTVTRKVGVKVLDGTESFGMVNNTFRFTLNDLPMNNKVICNYFDGNVSPTVSTSNQPDLTIKVNATSNNTAYFKYAAKTTVGDFQQWLAEQYANGTPVIVVYPLATETTESVTGQTLQVQDGDNTLEITQASLDGLELEAKYMKGVVASAQEVEPQGLDNNVSVSLS